MSLGLSTTLTQDYYPNNYVAKYPRKNVRWSSGEDNEYRGWAWRANVQGADDGLLAGKTLCLKDNICLAGVPLTFGTKALEDYIREWSLSSSLMLQPPSMPS